MPIRATAYTQGGCLKWRAGDPLVCGAALAAMAHVVCKAHVLLKRKAAQCAAFLVVPDAFGYGAGGAVASGRDASRAALNALPST